MNKIWRPWVDTPEEKERKTRQRYMQPHGQQHTEGNIQHNPQFKHPVRLVWTKAAYDYMYASGETLLRNFPVQATIQLVDWNSDSSDEEEADEDYECDEQEITKKCTQCKALINSQKCRQCEARENTKTFKQ